MRILLATTLLVFSSLGWAANSLGYVFTVSPNPAQAGVGIAVSIQTTHEQCVPLPDSLYPAAGEPGFILLSLPFSDACESVPPESRNYSVGPLAAGQYVFRFRSCAELPDGVEGDGCATIEDVPMTVLGLSATRHTIPTMSGVALVGLALLLLVIGVRLPWR